MLKNSVPAAPLGTSGVVLNFPSGSCFPVLDVAVGEGGTPGVVRREVPEVLQGQRGPVADAELFVLLRPTGSKGRGSGRDAQEFLCWPALVRGTHRSSVTLRKVSSFRRALCSPVAVPCPSFHGNNAE